MTIRRMVIEIEKEDDGRIIAELMQYPGVMEYGATEEEALLKLAILIARTLANGQKIPPDIKRKKQ